MNTSIAVIPNQVDILCGVGHEATHHAGNVSFRQTVADHFDNYYDAVSKKSKMQVSKAIQCDILASGARFLKKDTSSTSRGYWYVADSKVGRDKISHVLRDMKNMRETESGQAKPPSPQQDTQSGGPKLGRPQEQEVLRHQPLATTLRQQQRAKATADVILHQQQTITQQKQAIALPLPEWATVTAASILHQQQTISQPPDSEMPQQPTSRTAAILHQQQASEMSHPQQPTVPTAAPILHQQQAVLQKQAAEIPEQPTSIATTILHQQHAILHQQAILQHQAILQQQAAEIPHPQQPTAPTAAELKQIQQATSIAAAILYQQHAILQQQAAEIPQQATAPTVAAYPTLAASILSQSDPRSVSRPEHQYPSVRQPPAYIQDMQSADIFRATASLAQHPAASDQQRQPTLDHNGSSDETMLSSLDEKSFSGVFADSGNGSSSNGISLHGISSHGVSSHGNASNGNASNGISSHSNLSNGNGISSNGVSSNGNASNGVSSNGILSNGILLNGLSSNGASSNGNASNSNTSNGNTSNGNVSSDERNARASDVSGNSQHPSDSS